MRDPIVTDGAMERRATIRGKTERRSLFRELIIYVPWPNPFTLDLI